MTKRPTTDPLDRYLHSLRSAVFAFRALKRAFGETPAPDCNLLKAIRLSLGTRTHPEKREAADRAYSILVLWFAAFDVRTREQTASPERTTARKTFLYAMIAAERAALALTTGTPKHKQLVEIN